MRSPGSIRKLCVPRFQQEDQEARPGSRSRSGPRDCRARCRACDPVPSAEMITAASPRVGDVNRDSCRNQLRRAGLKFERLVEARRADRDRRSRSSARFSAAANSLPTRGFRILSSTRRAGDSSKQKPLAALRGARGRMSNRPSRRGSAPPISSMSRPPRASACLPSPSAASPPPGQYTVRAFVSRSKPQSGPTRFCRDHVDALFSLAFSRACAATSFVSAAKPTVNGAFASAATLASVVGRAYEGEVHLGRATLDLPARKAVCGR